MKTRTNRKAVKTETNYLLLNTSDEKPYALYFSNFGYYSQKGPFASVDEALIAAKAAGFDSAVYFREGDLVATFSCIGGARRIPAPRSVPTPVDGNNQPV
jgi:hypothetical protein